MKYFFMFVLFIGAGYFAYQQLKPKPVPPPPPPPPILSKLSTMKPLLSPQDERRIARSVDDTNESVRWQALKLLASGRSSLALPLLFKHLHRDQSLSLRVKILGLLSKYPDNNDVLNNLVAALGDYNPEIRLATLKALGAMNAYATAANITALLKDPEESVRQQALTTLNDLQKNRQEEITKACKEWQQEVQAIKAAQTSQNNPGATIPPEPEECAVPMVK